MIPVYGDYTHRPSTLVHLLVLYKFLGLTLIQLSHMIMEILQEIILIESRGSKIRQTTVTCRIAPIFCKRMEWNGGRFRRRHCAHEYKCTLFYSCLRLYIFKAAQNFYRFYIYFFSYFYSPGFEDMSTIQPISVVIIIIACHCFRHHPSLVLRSRLVL